MSNLIKLQTFGYLIQSDSKELNRILTEVVSEEASKANSRFNNDTNSLIEFSEYIR